jgi:integrase
VHEKWIKLQQRAREGPVATKVPSVGEDVAYWLREIVKPNLSPGTYVTYEVIARLYIVPGLGGRRLDRLQTREVQTWINAVGRTCPCCAQGKDARRPVKKRRCCAIGKCCHGMPSATTIVHIRRIIRTVLSQAITDGLVTRNIGTAVKLPVVRKCKRKAWSSDEARRFLESARSDADPFYAAYVLVLVLGMRKGVLLGLTWDDVDLVNAELAIGWQLQRVGKALLHRETKSEPSDATLPLPDICVVALRQREQEEAAARTAAGAVWQGSNLVSPPDSAPRSSRATSTASGTVAASRPGSGRSPSTTLAAPAARCSLTLTCIPGWRCRSSGMPSFRSPWRSTQWSRRLPPGTP